MSSRSALFLYNIISQAYSEFLEEHLIDNDQLPLLSTKRLHEHVLSLCTVTHEYHSKTQTTVEILDKHTIKIDFSTAYKNKLYVAEITLSDVNPPKLYVHIHKYTPVVRSFAPLICDKVYESGFLLYLNRFSEYYNLFVKTSNLDLYQLKGSSYIK